jgi:rhodanese-related sulfurtransferase
MQTRSAVLEHPVATPADAAAHFAARLSYETDCSDVGADIAAGVGGFVVIDTRSPALYLAGHVPGAVSLPHRRITAEIVALLPADVLLVTYCNGPHCNASTRGALRLTALGRQVKEMPGGMDGWIREGLPVER